MDVWFIHLALVSASVLFAAITINCLADAVFKAIQCYRDQQ